MAGQWQQAGVYGVPESRAGSAQAQARPRRLGLRITVVAVLTAAASAGAWFCAPYAAQPFVGPPSVWQEGTAPLPPVPVLASANDQAPVPTAAGVDAALSALAHAPGLGSHTAVSVVDVVSGQALFKSQDGPAVPASTTKIVTAATVLAVRGPAHQLTTRAVAGPGNGQVVLVGAGDPTLTTGANGTYPGAARLDDLAAQVLASLGGVKPTRVIYDASLFSGDAFGPGWDADIQAGGYASAVTALMIDGARSDPKQKAQQTPRHAKPDLAAAQAFAKLLGLSATAVSAGTAQAGATELGHVDSPPLGRIVEIMVNESDNVIAEVMARQVAVARNQPATFAGATATMKAVLGELGIPTGDFGLVDGSGLSRNNRLSASLLTSIISVAARSDNAKLHTIFAGLPVAGYSGTLRERYTTVAGGASVAGNARAKTGTLSGVSAVAGIVVDTDGRILAFAALADAVPAGKGAETGLDRLVAALGACGCR